MDTFYLIQITKENTESMVDDIDDYGHRVNKGVMHLEGNFLEKNPGSDRIYKVSKKRAFFYNESVVYPFVQMIESKKGLVLSDDESMQITTGLTRGGG